MGFLAHRLEKIRKESDFFIRFHLEEMEPARQEGGKKIVTFKPAGEAFRDLVTVTVTVDGEGRIREMELVLTRSFVDDTANGIYARDIAKSLLSAAVPRENQADVAGLVGEIEIPISPAQPASGTGRAQPQPPGSQTLGYQVFLGKEKHYEQVLSRCVVRLENRSGALKMSLSNRDQSR